MWCVLCPREEHLSFYKSFWLPVLVLSVLTTTFLCCLQIPPGLVSLSCTAALGLSFWCRTCFSRHLSSSQWCTWLLLMQAGAGCCCACLPTSCFDSLKSTGVHSLGFASSLVSCCSPRHTLWAFPPPWGLLGEHCSHIAACLLDLYLVFVPWFHLVPKFYFLFLSSFLLLSSSFLSFLKFPDILTNSIACFNLSTPWFWGLVPARQVLCPWLHSPPFFFSLLRWPSDSNFSAFVRVG